jgi:glucose/arabinose dehydrogenase
MTMQGTVRPAIESQSPTFMHSPSPIRPGFRLFFPLALAATAVAPLGASNHGRDAKQLYAQYCADCHGDNLAGSKGPTLISGTWKHGGSYASLRRTIQEGWPEFGMPAFKATLNEAETQALINYLRESATRAVDPAPNEERPLPVGIQHSEKHDYRIEPVVEGLDVPWSLAFLPDGRILVTERVGRLRVIDHGQLLPEPVAGVPRVVVRDEAGLMSVVADPDFAHSRWIYLSYSDPGDGDTAMTKIIRAQLRGNRLVNQQTIFALPREKYPKGYVLFGCRMVFQGDYLFFSVGVRGMEDTVSMNAQDVTVPNGKIHRVYRDGRVPKDNPFVKTPGAWPSIWAYGNRNPQGLALDPRNGELWETEHGPRGGDELNHIQRGRNYGWPVITYGINYDGTPISDKTRAPGMEQPVINWTPSIAVSEIEFYIGNKFPNWKNNLFIGSLAQQKFLRVVLDGDKVVHREEVFHGLGRVRDIKTGPDGDIYIALELIGKLGRIVRLVPAEESVAHQQK